MTKLYKYVFGNDMHELGKYRKQYKNLVCRIMAIGKMNTVEVEFLDNKERITCSLNAIRKLKI